MFIYRIQISDYVYIGSTKNKRKRKNDHLRSLTTKKHFNKKMQNVYNKHQKFSFEIIKNCENLEEMKDSEENLIKEYKETFEKKCMNILDVYGGGSEWRQNKSKEELEDIDYRRTNLTLEQRRC